MNHATRTEAAYDAWMQKQIIATFRVTINGITRWIEARDVSGDGKRFVSIANVALARVGRTGSKLWPSTINIWQQKDGSYRPAMNTVHLNRQAVIVAWSDAVTTDSNHLSAHNSAGHVAPLEAK